MKKKKYLSDCCKAKAIPQSFSDFIGGREATDQTTNYYVCEKCKKSCNIMIKEEWCKCKKPDLAVDINEPACRKCLRKWKPRKK